MTCLRCEVIRAKVIATGLVGLRWNGAQILADLRGRYGDVYFLEGKRIMRKTPAENLLIIEVRR